MTIPSYDAEHQGAIRTWTGMSVFRERYGSVLIEVHDVDHGPPHCHVSGLPGGLTARVNVLTLEVTRPAGFKLPATLRRRVKERQLDMLAAWELVEKIDRSD
jgi:hypothetical protein